MDAALKTKIEKLETISAQGRALLAQYPDGLPAEQQVRASALLEESGKLREEIKTARAAVEVKRDLEGLDSFLNDPATRLPHGVNGDHAERKTLEAAGWEFKAGMIHKMTSTGDSVPMFPEDVLFGEIPTKDAVAAEFYRTTRASMAGEYKTAYANLIKATSRYGAAALSMLSGAEQKALSEGTDTSGGFTVPPDVQAEMLSRTAQMAVMRQVCTVQPTNRDVLRYPAVKANASTYGGISGASIYANGFVGSWAGETPAFSDTDPAFQVLDIPVRKVRVATKLSNDFVNDSAVNILAFMAQSGAKNMALTEDFGFLLGSGASLQPQGLINAGATNVDIEGSTSDTISNTTSSTGSGAKLLTLTYTLPAQYTGNAKWIMARLTEGQIRKLVSPAGNYLWPPFAGSAYTGRLTELLGFPILHSDWMPADGQDTQPVLFLGDFSNYIIAQRTQITSLVLRERFADSDQVGIILFERLGGGIFNTDAIRGGIC